MHGVKPGNIVGAIANEADLESKYIGRIDIHDDHSILDLPEGMPKPLLMHLKKVRVAGQMLRIQKADEFAPAPGARPPRTFKPRAEGEGKPGNFRPRTAHPGKPGGKFAGKPGGGKFTGKPGGKPPRREG
jgi:ATP-dependent RNA helicase DeaD